LTKIAGNGQNKPRKRYIKQQSTEKRGKIAEKIEQELNGLSMGNT
jgi:hypothetical protein